MDKFVYTIVPATLKVFLEKIQSSGVPDKLTVKFIETLGFKSKNERALIPIMKAMGFVTEDGTPTDRWKRYRDKSIARAVLAEGVREHYEALFRMYPDANRKDNEALTNYFNTQTSVGERAIGAMVQTFRALVENADFESPDAPPLADPISGGGRGPIGGPIRTQVSNPGAVININIQLTLPDTTNVDTYEAIFKALKKHLLSQE